MICAPNRRIERTGPSRASGGMIALTREPSGTSVNHRRRLVDATANPADDAVDDRQQVRVVFKPNLSELQFSAAFNVDPVVPIYQDIRDAGFFEEWFQWTETQHPS